MHDNFQFAATIIAIFAGILFNRTDARRLEDRLEARFVRIEETLNLIQRDLREFYATQKVHDEAIDSLKKRGER